MASKNLSPTERKKQALRDNLKRRKSQIRDLKGDSEAALKIRKDGFSPKTANQKKDVDDSDNA